MPGPYWLDAADYCRHIVWLDHLEAQASHFYSCQLLQTSTLPCFSSVLHVEFIFIAMLAFKSAFFHLQQRAGAADPVAAASVALQVRCGALSFYVY